MGKKIRYTLVLILMNFSFWGNAQKLLNFHQLTPDDGLSQSTNEFLYTDKDGYTWISALDGLNRFDGEKVEVFKANRNDPQSIKGANIQSPFFEDEEGNIWFTTSEAINCYQKKKGYFLHDYAKGFSSNSIGIHHAFYMEKNRFLWIYHANNIYRYDTHNPKISARKPIIKNIEAIRYAINFTPDGLVTIYAGNWTRKPGLEIIHLSSEYKEISRDTFFNNSNNQFGTPQKISQILTDKNGTWLKTNLGLIHFDKTNPENSYQIPSPIENTTIKYVAPHSQNLLWVKLSNVENYFFDKKNKVFLRSQLKFFNLDNRKNINSINDIFSTRDSMVWISKKGFGLYYSNIANNKFEAPFNLNSLPEKSVDNILEKKDETVLCTSKNGKTWLFDKNKNLIQTGKAPFYTKHIWAIDSTIWNISWNGLGQLVDDSIVIKHPVQASDSFYDLVDFNHNYLIAAMNRGIVFYDKNNQNLIPSKLQEFTVKLFIDSKNRLWSGSASTSLYLWNINLGTSPFINPIDTFSNLGTILHITEDTFRNIILVGTSNGLIKIDANTLKKEVINEASGIPNQYIHYIGINAENRIFLSTNKGLIEYLPEEEKENQFTHFTSRDGLSANEYVHGSGIISKNGEIWFGSTKGVDVIDPKNIRAIGKQPQLAINSLKIHDKEWGGDTIAINSVNKINLDHDENTLVFDLAALEYTDPERNQFKVILQYKNKKDTTFLNTKNTITYANLSYGKYLFQFTASNAEGVWQEKYRNLEIVIHPPIHKTWWFRTLVLLALMALVGFISSLYYRIQLRAKALELEKQEREAERKRLELEKTITLQNERTRIAGEMHDEIGSGLSTIRYASSAVGKRNTIEDVKKVMNRVSQISINLIKNMRGIIWAMDPDFDSLEDLCAYIRRDSKEYLDDNDLNAEINIPDELPTIVMSGPARHNIALVVKETLHNIVKHAEANFINFDLTIIDDQLKIRIKDNGKGFDMDQLKRRGHGLRNMTRRMKTIEGHVDWKRLYPKGMQVTITLSLAKKKAS